jgi:hypothetical protein
MFLTLILVIISNTFLGSLGLTIPSMFRRRVTEAKRSKREGSFDMGDQCSVVFDMVLACIKMDG